MIYLGEFVAGETVPYMVRFHSDVGTVEDPATPTARRRDPNQLWYAMTAPTKQDSVTGLYGGTIDTTSQTVGLHIISVQGVVSTAKTVGAVLTYRILASDAASVMARIGANGSGLTSLAPASTALSTATWTNTKAGYLDAAVSSNAIVYGIQNITYNGSDQPLVITLVGGITLTHTYTNGKLTSVAVA